MQSGLRLNHTARDFAVVYERQAHCAMKKKDHFAFFKKRLPLIAVTLSGLMLVSCVPMTTEFYRPAAIDGRVVSAHCPPVESFILFEINGVILGSKASKAKNGLVTVTMTFEIPRGKTVRLRDHEIHSLISNQVFASSKLRGRVWVSAGRTVEFLSTTPMPGKTEKKAFFKQITFYGTTEHAYYFFSGQLSVPDQESFTVKLPNFSVNDVEVRSPEIRFSEDGVRYWGSLNC